MNHWPHVAIGRTMDGVATPPSAQPHPQGGVPHHNGPGPLPGGAHPPIVPPAHYGAAGYGGGGPSPAMIGSHPGLVADSLRKDPWTGRISTRDVSILLDVLRMTNDREGELARIVASLVPQTVRPLQGQSPNIRGMSQMVAAADVLSPVSLLQIRSAGDDAEAMSLLLDAQPLSEPGDDEEMFFRALLTWGVGNASFSAELDVIRGTQVSVTANVLSVSMRGIAVGPVQSAPVDYRLSAAAGYYPTGHPSAPARFTDPLGTIVAGGGATSRVPNFATTFTVVCNADAPNLQIRVLGGGPDATNFQNYFYTNATNTAWHSELTYPLDGRARFVEVDNNAVGQDVNVSVLYGLSL